MKKIFVIGIILLTAGSSWAQSDPAATSTQGAIQGGASGTTGQRPRNPFAAAIASSQGRKTPPQPSASMKPASSAAENSQLPKQPFRVPRPSKAQQQARRLPSRAAGSKNQNLLVGNSLQSSGRASSAVSSQANQNQLIRNPVFQPVNPLPQTAPNPTGQTSAPFVKSNNATAMNTFQMEPSKITAAKDVSQQKT